MVESDRIDESSDKSFVMIAKIIQIDELISMDESVQKEERELAGLSLYTTTMIVEK